MLCIVPSALAVPVKQDTTILTANEYRRHPSEPGDRLLERGGRRTRGSLEDLRGVSNDLAERAVGEAGAQGEAPCAAHHPAGLHHGVQPLLDLPALILVA